MCPVPSTFVVCAEDGDILAIGPFDIFDCLSPTRKLPPPVSGGPLWNTRQPVGSGFSTIAAMALRSGSRSWLTTFHSSSQST